MSWHHGLLRSKPILYALTLAAICLAGFIILRVPMISPDRQRQLQTQTNAMALLQAVEGYFQQYNRLPESLGKVGELQTEGEEARALLLTLLAKNAEGKDESKGKRILFLNVEVTTAKKKGGLLYQDSGTNQIPEGLYDAWGRPFHLRCDSDYNGEIPDPLKAGEVIRNKVVIVYSYGKDGKPGGGDDIKTW